MKTEYAFADSLKRIMTTVPLDEITVERIAKSCNKSRQTFYYHFRDIYDLLSWIFIEEKGDYFKKVNNINELLNTLLQYYENNEKFVKSIMRSAGQDLLLSYFYNVCYKANLRFINMEDINNCISNDNRKRFANAYASLLSNSIIRYIDSEHQNKKEFLNSIKLILGDYVKDVVIRFQNE